MVNAMLYEKTRPAGLLLRLGLVLLCLFCQVAHAANRPLVFKPVRPGVEFALTTMDDNVPSLTENAFVVLRVDPGSNSFALGMASERGEALSLPDWCVRERLLAGINAGMYLPDRITSTGYMRNGASVNNPAMGGRLGAFFVSDGKSPHLPGADIIERSGRGWRNRLDRYGIVVQNYRLISSRGELLWKENHAANSIAVIARDRRGRILFALSQKPLTVNDFTSTLKALVPDLGVVMYVEGGSQAGMFLRIPAPGGNESAQPKALPGATVRAVPGGFVHVWKGRQNLLGLLGSPDALLPNVIGVRW